MGSPREMIREIKEGYGLNAPEVFSAMYKVPREEFVPSKFKNFAFDDGPVFIGHGQTISQPYTVAFMTNLLDLKGKEKVLEIGTGSGYQAAILSLMANYVYTIERIPELVKDAEQRLKKLGYKNIEVRGGSGEFGWKENAPYDAILVTAGMEQVPQELFDELKEGGILVAPIGGGEDREMTKFTKKAGKIRKQQYGTFNFVPFITAFKKTPDFQSGDELNSDMSSSFGRGNRGLSARGGCH